jgi:hypothetical protein
MVIHSVDTTDSVLENAVLLEEVILHLQNALPQHGSINFSAPHLARR